MKKQRRKDNYFNILMKKQRRIEKMEEVINIILDESDPTSLVFVEIENDKGESISIGERERHDDGLIKLRITAMDLINHMAL